MPHPLRISVAMPVYEGDRHLGVCLDGIAAQTRPPDELVISYDPSRDATWETVTGFAARHPWARVVRNPDRPGIFTNLNTAIRHTSGDLVQIFCQDDIMRPDLLARLEAAAGPALGRFSFCFFRGHTIDDGGRALDRPRHYDGLPSGLYDGEAANELFIHFGCLPGNLSTVAVDGALARSLPFRDTLSMTADFMMWLDLVARRPFLFLDETLVDLRAHAGRATFVLGRDLRMIGEDRPILETLIGRSGRPGPARSVLLSHRGVQYVSWIGHAARHGDWPAALAGIALLRRSWGLFPVLWRYLVRLGGRADPLGLGRQRRDLIRRLSGGTSHPAGPSSPSLLDHRGL
ncbi:glycosyltransferase family 2 protein [Rhodocista pekingensis]|uniref:Glycosyltransferase family 2 protein n=1 Tax=Rhodocista pekingensis TaxID=201185 RepID=A0ABW2KZY2_9PROT